MPWSLYIFFPIIWVAILLLLSIYDGRKNLRIVDEFTSLTMGALLASVSLAGTLYMSYREISRLLFVIFFLIAYFLMLTWRILARISFRSRTKNGQNMQLGRVLIVGAGPVGRDLQVKINQVPYWGFQVVGFLDDDHRKREKNKDILGTTENASKIVKQYDINDVVIALPQRAYNRVDNLVADLHNIPVKVWIIPDYFHLALTRAVIEEFAGIPMLDLRAPALNDYQRMLKRLFDLIITFLLLPISLLVMSLIALAIRIEGPGPILFRQKRVGENGRLFEMLKFRTMVPEAENLRHLVERFDEKGNLIHKTDNDPRITTIGRFLRKTSIDELPQLFNILKGEMSLVGPRPELPYLVDRYEPWQRKRFSVPQGITGWWQVNGRSDRPMHLHTEDDLYYVKNYSLLLDIEILVKTVAVVIRGRGAY